MRAGEQTELDEIETVSPQLAMSCSETGFAEFWFDRRSSRIFLELVFWISFFLCCHDPTKHSALKTDEVQRPYRRVRAVSR
jgi:hypothetical protein